MFDSAGGSLFKVSGDGSALFSKSGAQRLRIYPNGYVALQSYGNDPVNARLFVQHGVDNSTALLTSHQPTFEPGSPNQTDYGVFVQTHENVQAGATNDGQLYGIYASSLLTGPGTLERAYGALIQAGTLSYSGGTLAATLNVATGIDVNVMAASGSTIVTGFGVMIQDVKATWDYGIYQAGANDDNYFAGNVAIGGVATGNKLEVYGNANFTGTVTGGNIQAKYQDVAEWVPSRADLTPGTVVVLDPDADNTVMASWSSYDTTVAGVVSAQPGIILGEQGSAKEQIATTGRVRVRVYATRAPIRIGDLLVTSDTSGTAMRSVPMEIHGRKLHEPGTIIGKALEPLSGGVGEILVLLSLQ